MTNVCERCGQLPRQRGERFCSPCRKELFKRMCESGYLTPLPWEGRPRGTGQREDVQETRQGLER